MKISLFPPLSIHEVGQRDNQEDSIMQEDNCFFVLCDGMGGHEHGEVASQTVCQSLREWYQAHAIHPIDKAQIEKALAYTYEQLDQKDEGLLKKMGTTLTLLYIGQQGALAAHMGDSRIYHIRPNSLSLGKGQKAAILYQSRDHSLVFDLYLAGELTYEEMDSYEKKNMVTRAMIPGKYNRMRSDIIQMTDIQAGDYFYMCSDGMLEQMSNQELLRLLSSKNSDEEKCKQLLTATAQNKDNHSAWLIHVRDVVREAGDEQLLNEEPTARCNVVNIMRQINEDTDVAVVSVPQAPKQQSFISKMLQVFRLGKK